MVAKPLEPEDNAPGAAAELEADRKEQVATALKRVIESSPLYRRESLGTEVRVRSDFPRFVDFDCAQCKTARTFHKESSGPYDPAVQPGSTHEVTFRCAACRANFTCWLEFPDKGSVRKVGQTPQWRRKLSADLERALGDADAKLYGRAQTLLEQNFGIGACAYMRRLVEKKTEPLLQLLREVAAADGVAPEKLRELDAVIATKNFTDKAEVAYACVPPSLIVDGDNPLKLLHDHLSMGLHTLSDDEAGRVAQRLGVVLEHLLLELTRRRDSRTDFQEAVRKLRTGPDSKRD